MSGDWLLWIDVAGRELMLFAAAGMVLIGIDDFLFDSLWLGKALRGQWRARSLADFGTPPATRFAVFVPAWQEANVIVPMVECCLARWAGQGVTIFVGCYANDAETLGEVERLAARHRQVRLVVNPRAGPTTKADNLNAIWSAMKAGGGTFDSAILHDAEDQVHPDELALYAGVLRDADMVQIPVKPLIDPHSRWIGGHYADEFAEAHAKELPLRHALGAPIPSAGVGTAFTTALLDRMADANDSAKPFAEASVTEDYELGLRAGNMGAGTCFVRATGRDGSQIMVEALFPDALVPAVRQKSRWVLGIALAGWDRLADRRSGAVPTLNQLGWRNFLIEHWMRWRDRRSVLAALLMVVGYWAALLWVASLVGHFVTQSGEGGTFAGEVPQWGRVLLGLTLAMLVWRLTMRVGFTGSVYGWREALRAVPRLLVSNIIAIMASARALPRYIASLGGGALQWDKTTHRFPFPMQGDNRA